MRVLRRARRAARPAAPPPILPAALLVTLLVAALTAALAVTVAPRVTAVPGEEAGAGPPAERTLQTGVDTAFITPLNLTGQDQSVRIARQDGGAAFSATLEVGEDVPPSFVPEVGATPVRFESTCGGCAPVTFGLAGGQRVLVLLVPPGDPAAQRGDVRIVNESGAQRAGSLRTGEEPGRGRRVLDFELADGEEAVVGVRVGAGALVALHVTCEGCTPQALRAANGVDLEVVLR